MVSENWYWSNQPKRPMACEERASSLAVNNGWTQHINISLVYEKHCTIVLMRHQVNVSTRWRIYVRFYWIMVEKLRLSELLYLLVTVYTTNGVHSTRLHRKKKVTMTHCQGYPNALPRTPIRLCTNKLSLNKNKIAYLAHRITNIR